MGPSKQLDLWGDPEPEPDEDASSSPETASRILGGLLGFACGDALGSFLEKEGHRVRTAVTEVTGEGSERTAMMLGTAEAVLRSPDDPLEGMDASRVRRDGAEATDNGSLPRALPIALAYPDARDLLLFTARLSALTHWNPQAEVCCGVYGLWIRELLAGADRYAGWRRALRAARAYEKGGALALDTPGPRPLPDRFWHRLEYVTDLTFRDLEPSGYAGYCLECLEASAWCAIFADDAEQAVVDAVNLGGASASLGALTGGASGVFWGVEGLPERWIAKLGERERIVGLARSLTETSHRRKDSTA